MAIQEIEYGSLASSTILNNNFKSLEDANTEIVSNFELLKSDVDTNLKSNMKTTENTINSYKTELETEIKTVNDDLSEFETKVKGWFGSKAPTMTKLVDWDTMNARANKSTVKNINNTTTGITAYGGDYKIPKNGDIYLKEDFTNYEKILLHFTNDSGGYNCVIIFDSWELDWLLNQNKGWTDLNKYDTGLYWRIWSYKYSSASTKKYFSCYEQNCGLVEIYGLTFERVTED